MDKNMEDNKIPLDVQWNDIEYMDKHLDFSYNKDKWGGLPQYVDNLHKKGMHYVMIIVSFVLNFMISSISCRHFDNLSPLLEEISSFYGHAEIFGCVKIIFGTGESNESTFKLAEKTWQ